MSTRIAKYISKNAGLSRREAEKYIINGRVKINNNIIFTPVYFVKENDKVYIDNELVNKVFNTELYAFNKPINTITTKKDPLKRKTVYDCIDKKYHYLKYIGRLDYKTTGLLLFTNDGNLARYLTMPSSNIKKVYLATTYENDFSRLEKVKKGVSIDNIKYRPMKIEILKNNVIKITVVEGKKNEIRNVFQYCNLPIKTLHRIKFGDINLGTLKKGELYKINQQVIDRMSKALLK